MPIPQEKIHLDSPHEMTMKLGFPDLPELNFLSLPPLNVDPICLENITISIDDGKNNWELSDLAEFFMLKLRSYAPKHFCFHCTRVFDTDSKLAQHLKGEKIVIPKTFRTYNGGKPVPILFQYGRKPIYSKCYLCNKRFYENSALQDHLSGHKPSDVPYRCIKCPFLATHYQVFLAHIKDEHANLAFCSYCLEEIEVKGLSVHWYDLTAELKDRMRDQMVAAFDHMKAHLLTKGKFGCKKCLATFLNEEKLARHLEWHNAHSNTSSGVNDQPTTSKSAIHQPTTSKSAIDQPTTSRSVIDQPTTSRSVIDQPSTSNTKGK